MKNTSGEFQLAELKNGIRIVHKRNASPVGHCGIMIHAGSRDEFPEEHGLAHYIEHTFFKGTEKRKSYHILQRIDIVGGDLNAYTSKEETCVYAAFMNQHLHRAIELIADICFHSTFPENEIEKEKDVIIDEIKSYLDTPSEQIFDDFDELLFKGHPLGRSILGTTQTLKKFKRNHILRFLKRNYLTGNIVLWTCGNYDFSEIVQLAERYLSDIKISTAKRKRAVFKKGSSADVTVQRNTHQAHRLIGAVVPFRNPQKRLNMILLNNILGGPGMNTRLNLNIREKYGYAYNLESHYTTYSDTGTFSLYLGTDIQHLDKTTNLVHKELDKLRTTKLGTLQLHQAKQQLMGNVALSQENYSSLMQGAAKALLVHSRLDPLNKFYDSINRIEASEMLELANEVFNPHQLSTITYIP
jgi:predicted Zn-dependent peptidase